jgi:hypothetical protein
VEHGKAVLEEIRRYLEAGLTLATALHAATTANRRHCGLADAALKPGAAFEAMLLDVQKEGAGEFVDSAEARAAIKKRAAKMFNERARKVKET